MFKFTDPVRFIKKLISFNKSLNKVVPAKVVDKNLVIGTWNIREFSKGRRLDESYAYMSEVVSRYDILAIQELKSSIEPLNKLKEHLGPHWEYLASHPCTSAKGNHERMAFLYDTRRVKFSGISSFIGHYGSRGQVSLDQFSRAPFMAGFHVGQFKFFLCNVHLYYDSGKSNSEFRRSEIKHLLERFEKQSWREKYGFTDNFIIMGDFNIPSVKSSSYSEIQSHGYSGFNNFINPSERRKTLYDQIIYRSNSPYFKNATHGRVNIFDYVYTDQEAPFYESFFKKTRMDFSQWRTYQMSDHDPLWIQLTIDRNNDYWLSKLKLSDGQVLEAQEAEAKAASCTGAGSSLKQAAKGDDSGPNNKRDRESVQSHDKSVGRDSSVLSHIADRNPSLIFSHLRQVAQSHQPSRDQPVYPPAKKARLNTEQLSFKSKKKG